MTATKDLVLFSSGNVAAGNSLLIQAGILCKSS